MLAPNAFKGTLSAIEAAEAMAEGAGRAMPGARLDRLPIADGGDGTMEVLVAGAAGSRRTRRVRGPRGESIDAVYGVLADGNLAVIEMARAAGLALVPGPQRDPRVTTTYGVGELMQDAHGAGARRFIIGIGGSATNDGGAGMAQALGYHLLDENGVELPPGGATRVFVWKMAWLKVRVEDQDGVEIARSGVVVPAEISGRRAVATGMPR